jgi:hypothetical protein
MREDSSGVGMVCSFYDWESVGIVTSEVVEKRVVSSALACGEDEAQGTGGHWKETNISLKQTLEEQGINLSSAITHLISWDET